MKTPRQTRSFTIITASIDTGTEGAARRRQNLNDRALTSATGGVTRGDDAEKGTPPFLTTSQEDSPCFWVN